MDQVHRAEGVRENRRALQVPELGAAEADKEPASVLSRLAGAYGMAPLLKAPLVRVNELVVVAEGNSSARYVPVMLVPSGFFATGTDSVTLPVPAGTSPCQAELRNTYPREAKYGSMPTMPPRFGAS